MHFVVHLGYPQAVATQRRLEAIEALLKIISNVSREPLASIQKSALKGSQGLATYLESAMHRLSGDTIFIAILALFRPKFLNHAHYQLARTGLSYSNNCNYDYLPIQHLHNAFNSQKITGTMKIFFNGASIASKFLWVATLPYTHVTLIKSRTNL